MTAPLGHDEDADEALQRRGVTSREAEVLRLLARRLTNAEIAAELYVSKRTVESHVAALLRKLQVADRAALIRAAPSFGVDDPQRDAHGAVNVGNQVRPLLGGAAADRHELAVQRHQTSFQRAINRIQQAIRYHEAAAERLDTLADLCESRSHTANDAARAVHLRRAADVRRHAQNARARAEQMRQRLRAYGIDPDPQVDDGT